MSLMNALWPYFGYLDNPIEDGKRAQESQLRIHKGCEQLIKEMSSYQYKKQEDFIEGECSVVEIDGKKLIEEIK